MPPGEILALRNEAVGAGRRQPCQPPHIARGEPHAVFHPGVTVGVVAATAFVAVEQLAADVSEQGLVGVLLDQLVQATAATAVAQALPFGACTFGHCIAPPERGMRIGHTSNYSVGAALSLMYIFRHT